MSEWLLILVFSTVTGLVQVEVPGGDTEQCEATRVMLERQYHKANVPMIGWCYRTDSAKLVLPPVPPPTMPLVYCHAQGGVEKDGVCVKRAK